VQLKELVETIESSLNKKAILEKHPMQPGDVQITYADISNARKELGYQPSFDLATGIRLFVEWYQQNKAELYADNQ
jgi:UDP-glucuronate 4-epimerase